MMGGTALADDANGGAADIEAPAGFRPLMAAGFSVVAGPLYWRMGEQGFEIGFRVSADKCNGMGTCHGGMIATLLDMQLALGARANDAALTDNFLPTISLQIDYLDAAPQGAWVSGQTEILKITRRMVFVQGVARADGRPVARGSAVLKIGADARGTTFDIGALLRGSAGAI